MLTVEYRMLINRDLPLVERGCTSKVVFDSRREARHIAQHDRNSNGQLHPYRCRYCDRWHLGHRHR